MRGTSGISIMVFSKYDSLVGPHYKSEASLGTLPLDMSPAAFLHHSPAYLMNAFAISFPDTFCYFFVVVINCHL